jgi:GNAT superfamily N-acetyltransferase
MDIRPIDVFDDEQFERWHAVGAAALSHGREYATVWTLPEAKILFRRPFPGHTNLASAAFDGPTMVGAATIFLPQLDNTGLVEPDVYVPPEHRRRGIGSALVEEVVRRAEQLGRKTLLSSVAVPLDGDVVNHPYARFATKHGFSNALMDVHRVLDLPVADELLDDLERRAAPHHRDYRLVDWVGACPDEYAESFVSIFSSLMAEAPTGDIDWEAEKYDVARLRTEEERRIEQRRQTYVCAALLGDEIVAYTLLAVPGYDPGNVFQWGTLVRPAHRGRRLGMAVKVRALRAMQRANPDRRVVHTWNAEVNTHMVAVNDALGFRPVEYLAEFQRKL